MIKDALKQFFIYGTGSIAQTALRFILLPLYLRFFEPGEYGVISLLLVVSSLVTMFVAMGIVSALFRLYYEAEIGERKRLVGTTWLWYLLGAALGGAILFINASWFSQAVFHTGDYSYPIRVLGALFFVSLLQVIPFNILRLEKKSGLYVGFSLFRFVIDFALKLYFIVFLGRGIGGYFESGVIAYIITLCFMLPFVLKYVSFSLDTSYLKQLLRLGFPFIFSGMAVWTLEVSDRLILNYFCGEAAVGIYSLAYTFANLFIVFLSAPITLLIDPFFHSYAAERSTEDTKRLLQKLLSYFFLVGSTLYLAISLGCGDVLRIFSSLFAAKEGYWQAATLVPLLTLAPFLYRLASPASLAGLLAKKPELGTIAACIAAAVNLGLNFIFIPRFGALGAAITTAIAYVLFIGLFYWWVQKIFPVSYDWKGLARGFLFLVISFIIGWQIGISQPWASLFARVAVGLAVFALLTWFISGTLTKAERHRLLAYLIDGRKRLATVILHRS